MKKLTHCVGCVLLSCFFVLSFAGCLDGGAKTVENMKYTMTFPVWDETGTSTEEVERTGTYSGEILDGVPNGNGRFDTENDTGVTWYYEGQFSNGLFNGTGVCCWDSEDYPDERGTYKDGLFTPTLSEFYAAVPQAILNAYQLNELSANFIAANETLFPCTTEEAKNLALSLTDESVGYEQMAKNITPYLETLFIADDLTATQVFEDTLWGNIYTTIIAMDQNFNNYLIYYNGSCDIYENDAFSVRALPLANGNFDNVSGGQTLVVTVLASIVETE